MNSITPLPRDWIPKLSVQLAETFSSRELQSADYFSPEVLEWKYFRARGEGPLPRSFIYTDGEKILTHIGAVFTDFRSTDSSFAPVPALHMIDWISSPNAGPGASALLADVLKKAPIQYALGSSEPARKVMLGFRYKEAMLAPLFRSVLSPLKLGAWKSLHGTPALHRRMALLGIDFAQNLKARNIHGKLSIHRTPFFGAEINEIIGRMKMPFLFSKRSAEILNYFFTHPHKLYSGWLLREGPKQRGFALTSCFPKLGIRAANIADCFLDTDDPQLWAESFSLLRGELKKQGADVVNCYGTVPWVEAGLRRAGYFRRARTPFYLRDMNKRLPENPPYFLTHLEGDGSFL